MWTGPGQETSHLLARRWFQVTTNVDLKFLIICIRSCIAKINSVFGYFRFQSFHLTISVGYRHAACNYDLASFLIPELLSSRFEKYVAYALRVPMYFVYRNTQCIHSSGLPLRVTLLEILLKLPGVQSSSISLRSYFMHSCAALSHGNMVVYLR